MDTIAQLEHVEFYYLDYVNNFLSISYFAEYYGWTMKHAKDVIKRGKKANKILIDQRLIRINLNN